MLADLGAGWKQYKAADGVKKFDAKSCWLKFGSGLMTKDKIFAGATLSDDAGVAFVYGTALVFRNPTAAKHFTSIRRLKGFTDCTQVLDDAAEKTRAPGNYVRVVATTQPDVGQNGLEAFYREDVGTRAADGTETPGGNYARYTFRHGRIVYVINVDAGSQPTDAANQALGQRVTDALTAVTTKINQRLVARGE